jgi:putative nucleotidyltransferase with HDIG domain
MIPEKVLKLIRKFEEVGAEICVVGGAVRDMELNREVKDWDFATNLTPEEMKKLFPKNSFYDNDFGTVGIVMGEDVFEVTTYRTEKGYTDKRHPDKVAWGKTIEEDLMRRDFTINAMALDASGKIIDLYGGREDIKNRLIRAVGNPDKRFREDALRMLRAIRIATQIGFLIEEKTFESIQKNATDINEIAGERIREELFKILVEKGVVDGIKLLKNSGLLAEIMPELLEGVGMEQRGHHIYDVWTHALETLKYTDSADPITRLAALLHDVGKPTVMKIVDGERTFHNHEVVGSRIASRIGKKLKFSNEQLDQLFRLTRWHMFTVTEMQTDKAVRRFIRNVTVKYLDEMIAVRRGDRLGSGASETSWRWEKFKERLVEVQKQPFTVKDLKVDGHDVMEVLQIKPSKKVGDILEELFAQVEEKPELNDREKLIEMMLQNAKVENN